MLNGNGNGHEHNTDWAGLIDSWGAKFLEDYGYSIWSLPTDHNPVVQIIEDNPALVHIYHEQVKDKNFNRNSLSRLASICQVLSSMPRVGQKAMGQRR